MLSSARKVETQRPQAKLKPMPAIGCKVESHVLKQKPATANPAASSGIQERENT